MNSEFAIELRALTGSVIYDRGKCVDAHESFVREKCVTEERLAVDVYMNCF
jgi:hypothetical protein